MCMCVCVCLAEIHYRTTSYINMYEYMSQKNITAVFIALGQTYRLRCQATDAFSSFCNFVDGATYIVVLLYTHSICAAPKTRRTPNTISVLRKPLRQQQQSSSELREYRFRIRSIFTMSIEYVYRTC